VKSFTSEDVAKLSEVNNNKKTFKINKSRKQGSCSNSERKNEFETGDSDDDKADGDAEYLFCSELFLA
jgi:hypothetical protein